MTIRKITTKSIIGSDSSYVGKQGELFYNPTGNEIKISDGETPGGVSTSSNSEIITSWETPNETTWKILTYNGGKNIEWTDSGDVTWWDADDIPSIGDYGFRGAMVEYHAYAQGYGDGTIIGQIMLACDYGGSSVEHWETISGNGNMNSISLWEMENERRLNLRGQSGQNQTIWIQWTSRIFVGPDFAC